MHIFQLVGIGLTATVLATILRQHSPQFATLISIFAGAVLLWMVVHSLTGVVQELRGMATDAKISQTFLTTVLKIIGIAYIVEFAAQVARDAGESALGGRIELAGKVGIVVLALPIFTDVVQTIVHLLP
ncbi:stage III sporulation protein AD [Alicyclobacillus hesperidum URH17-3-68]|uniref:Stage III sporulation protein AD n=1 Tax=Alicyclobacillus hesperidum TaxID=89784 RepID=A0A1H2T5C3_9BACL|nr:stage III sporulation protein AD [Alicyclobacillus hesperidum]KRW91980.1 stage III sporulation protein AD [Alicyclobacillus tengchongensis]EJY55925.1 stage III sporulation protein AD [Alicyclobacillus hesperidum URH17-3-68]SDW38977.1 stage III sporulation protein AD [Alicyclobacillus hesperidum]GLG00958.1 stage III sporulation protein AD [Alicyclobacillus hesperidum subsp. aegles]GLV13764.1 stage III sporulation protein AD [Alicyclobacillus hesperidum]